MEPKNVRTGYRKEKKVIRLLERKGWEILKDTTSGPADIVARKGGRYWFIQVKYTRSREMSADRFDKEREPLIRMATKYGGTAVLCYVVQTELWFVSAKTGKTLMRGRLT